MLPKLCTSPRRNLLAPVLVGIAVLFGGFLVGRATVAQPHMRAALEHLQVAKTELQVADIDKGGHRVKAIRLVNDAIAEVEAGMEYARTH